MKESPPSPSRPQGGRRARAVAVTALSVGTLLALAPSLSAGAAVTPPPVVITGGRPDGLPDSEVRADRSRPASPTDLAPLGAPSVPTDLARRGWSLADAAVNNTDPAFADSDQVDDGEPVIAVDPRSPQRVALFTGRDGWEYWGPGGCVQDPSYCPKGAGNAKGSIWLSDDGGRSWSKRYDIPTPDGVGHSVCVCDRVMSWAPDGTLVSAFLVISDAVYAATTTDPFDASRWEWTVGGDGKAQPVARHDALPVQQGDVGAHGYLDQPWIVTAPDPLDRTRQNVFVSYADDGSRGDDVRYPLWISVSHGTTPLAFTDRTQIWKYPVCCDGRPSSVDLFPPLTGTSVMTLKLAADRRSGIVWALYGVPRAAAFMGPQPSGQAFDVFMRTVALVDQRLIRSADGGRTWTLGGSAEGITVDSAFSAEMTDKFATFNGLYGGSHSAAVDSNDGALYYVYADFDVLTKRNRLALRRVVADAGGNPTIGAKTFVTGQVDAALPAVAVSDDGTIGILYDTHDGFDSQGYPIVSAHLARSYDHGATFTDSRVATFSSVEKEDPNDGRQRPLGDYQQLVAVGNTFYGVFTANGAAFGRPIADWDPVVVRAPSHDR